MTVPYREQRYKAQAARARKAERTAKAIVIAWLTWLSICLIGAAAVIFVVVHFIVKFW